MHLQERNMRTYEQNSLISGLVEAVWRNASANEAIGLNTGALVSCGSDTVARMVGKSMSSFFPGEGARGHPTSGEPPAKRARTGSMEGPGQEVGATVADAKVEVPDGSETKL